MDHLEAVYKARISKVLLDGFEKELLGAAFVNLSVDNQLRFNNFAYALRELLRHVLHRLASDQEIQECRWFKPDPSSSTGITRKHRMKYAIQGGLSDFYMTKKIGIDDIEEISDKLIAIIKLLNEYTHIEKRTFNLENEKIQEHSKRCLEATLGFINLMNDTRLHVIEMLVDDIDSALVNRIITESVEDIMDLSTHQFTEEIHSDEVLVENIGPKALTLRVFGYIDCELHYGSGSDFRRGDGVIFNESFPIDALLSVEFKAPLGSSIIVEKLNVDTSSWYE